jgi:16S rRNA (guanine966-N2)-methyltransferase
MDQVRQALFNLAGERVKGARVLDLFAGSGALGMEALSRGARHVTFVDSSLFCVRAIESNLEGLLPAARGPRPATVLRADALAAIRRMAREHCLFDLVLLDPPYGTDLARISLNALTQHAIVVASGWVVVEHDKRLTTDHLAVHPAGRLGWVKSKRYGDTVLTIYERQ